MAYTNIWDDTKPTGSEAANTIDDLMRSGKVDIEQRFNDMFAMPSFATDPLRLYGLKFTDAQDSVINLGDNAGPSRSLIVKNKTGSTTYSTLNSAGLTVNVISGFGQAPEANNAVAIRGATSDGTSNILLGRDSGGNIKFSVGSDGSSLFSALVLINTASGIQPLRIVGINATSRFSRNEAAFTGALIQFDRSGTAAGYIGMDSSDNLTLQRGLDAANTVTINRSTGLFTIASGLTVAAGATTLQALNVSGQITNTQDGRQYLRTGASTGNQYFDISNTTGRLFLGIEQSTGGSLAGGTTGYATVLSTVGSTVLQLCTNQTIAMTIGTAQAVTFSGLGKTIILNGASTGYSAIGVSNTSGSLLVGVLSSTGGGAFSGTGNNYAGFIGTDVNQPLDFFSNSIRRGGFSAAGVFDVTGATSLQALTASQGAFTSASTNRASAISISFGDIAGHGRLISYGANAATIGTLDIFVSSSDGSQSWNMTFAALGGFTVPNGFTVANGGMGVTGSSVLQALSCTTLNTSGLATVNSLLSVGAITTNQNDLTFIGGAVDTLFKNSANNATNVSISDAGDLVALRGIINTATGYRVGNAAASGNFLRGNGTNYVGATISTSDLPTLDSVRAYKSSAAQALSQNTLTAISFDAEDYDTNTMHDNVTNNSRLTAQSAGKYKITAHIGWTGAASNVFVTIRKNGVATNLATTFLTVTNTSVGTTEVSCTLSLAASDYVEVYGQGDNVTPNILNNQERTYFEMQKLTA